MNMEQQDLAFIQQLYEFAIGAVPIGGRAQMSAQYFQMLQRLQQSKDGNSNKPYNHLEELRSAQKPNELNG